MTIDPDAPIRVVTSEDSVPPTARGLDTLHALADSAGAFFDDQNEGDRQFAAEARLADSARRWLGDNETWRVEKALVEALRAAPPIDASAAVAEAADGHQTPTKEG